MAARAAGRLRIGTRASRLALVQTNWVISQLEPHGLEFEEKRIATAGDITKDKVTGDGVFVKEIEKALLAGEIDLAVHSLKDVPTDPTDGITIAAIPRREDAREGLVGGVLDQMPPGVRIGTGSPRRSAQIKSLRSDLAVVPIRGNVPTRIAKVERKEVDAAVLAVAGLRRLGLEPDQIFDERQMLPAPGQGALAVQARADDLDLISIIRAIDDRPTRAAVSAERAVLQALGGGCLLPVAAWGRVRDGSLSLDAVVVSPDGGEILRASSSGAIDSWPKVAKAVANVLEKDGARALLEKFDL